MHNKQDMVSRIDHASSVLVVGRRNILYTDIMLKVVRLEEHVYGQGIHVRMALHVVCILWLGAVYPNFEWVKWGEMSNDHRSAFAGVLPNERDHTSCAYVLKGEMHALLLLLLCFVAAAAAIPTHTHINENANRTSAQFNRGSNEIKTLPFWGGCMAASLRDYTELINALVALNDTFRVVFTIKRRLQCTLVEALVRALSISVRIPY